jgi:hypothetical protein
VTSRELYFLKIRAECGELIRVVGTDQVAEYEARRPLPELVTFGSAILYRVVYSSEGELSGAVKFSVPAIADRATSLIRGLYAQGEDLESFFRRDVAPLPPPRGETAGG